MCAEHLERLPGGALHLLLACLGLLALVSALLNLDTAAVFMTPVLLLVAERRGVDRAPFLYGAIFMANASSLFLPGSNLTNLLVLDGPHAGAGVSGGTFLGEMLGYALPACLLTAAGVVVIHRRALLGEQPAARRRAREREPVALEGPLALAGVVVAGGLIVWLANPALPVLAVGLLLLAHGARTGRTSLRTSMRALGVPSLAGLFVLAVALGTLARASSFPGGLLDGAGRPATAAAGALASVLVNNLPAAVLLSSRHVAHTGALLLGLNVGPNLAVTGSLSVLLWWRAARSVGVRPSALAYSAQGVALVALAMGGALLVDAL